MILIPSQQHSTQASHQIHEQKMAIKPSQDLHYCLILFLRLFKEQQICRFRYKQSNDTKNTKSSTGECLHHRHRQPSNKFITIRSHRKCIGINKAQKTKARLISGVICYKFSLRAKLGHFPQWAINLAVNLSIQQILITMQSQFIISIFQFESMKMDYELYQVHPQVFQSPIIRPTPIPMYMFQEPSNREETPDNFQDKESLEQATNHEGALYNQAEFSSASEGKQKKRKAIVKKGRKNSHSIQDSASEPRNFRKAKPAKSTYPTKNFLPNFKGPHLGYLEKYLGTSVNQHHFIQYLRNKDGISLKDYQNLYKMQEFSQALASMFQCRYLYRDLLLSRSDPQTKKIHHRKLHVFEQAFESKIFAKIN